MLLYAAVPMASHDPLAWHRMSALLVMVLVEDHEYRKALDELAAAAVPRLFGSGRSQWDS
ncbi:hypothetical protein [Kitasatospora sp. NPDC001683]